MIGHLTRSTSQNWLLASSPLLEPFMDTLPCQVPVSPADCWAQHWISDPWVPRYKLPWGLCVGEKYLFFVTLRHVDPNAAYATFKKVVRWALCTYSAHTVTLNECLVFMGKVLATLSPPWSYTLIPAPRCINSIHAHSEMTINTHSQTGSQSPFPRRPPQNPSWHLLRHLYSFFFLGI